MNKSCSGQGNIELYIISTETVYLVNSVS